MANLASVRFLIVDDSESMRRIVRSILLSFGAKTMIEAPDAHTALAKIVSDQPDIVITDYNMPEMSGVEFVRALRSEDGTSRAMTPVIMLTAHAHRSYVIAARDSGVNEFCAKPVRPTDLWQKIAAVIDRPRPFIKAPNYFGPCRRRRIEVNGVVLERRKSAPPVAGAA